MYIYIYIYIHIYTSLFYCRSLSRFGSGLSRWFVCICFSLFIGEASVESGPCGQPHFHSMLAFDVVIIMRDNPPLPGSISPLSPKTIAGATGRVGAKLWERFNLSWTCPRHILCPNGYKYRVTNMYGWVSIKTRWIIWNTHQRTISLCFP